MDIHHVLTEYDSLFCVTKPGEIDRFLDEKIREAAAEPDESALLTLLNEQIGFCRDTGQEEKALELIRRTKMLCQKMGVIGTAAYGSTLMNMASAFREFGHYEEAAACYPEIEEIYRNSLPAGAIDFAGLYNNWSLLLTKQGDVNGSIRMLERALEITDGIPEAVIPQATSRVNIALALAGQNDRKGARQYLEESIVRFESAGGDDYHYSAALSAMGDLLLSDGHAAAAAENYEKAMTIMKRYMGENPIYQNLKKKRDHALSLTAEDPGDESAVDRCERFYREKGAMMIREKFPNYESRIAVGVAGEGSDMLGYDDRISRDHDYGVGFCMWLTEEDYEAIGESLQREYRALLDPSAPSRLDVRRGVSSIRGYYQRVLGLPLGEDYVGLTAGQWFRLAESALAEATSGRVFRDDLGVFSRIREDLLAYYPDRIRKMRLANAAHDFAQYAQVNYGRSMDRGDLVTAELCKAKGMEAAMDMTFLINGVYGPYYKWKFRAVKELEGFAEFVGLLEKLGKTAPKEEAWVGHPYDPQKVNTDDPVCSLFEQLAEFLVRKLNENGLSRGEETFMEYHCNEIAAEAAKEGELNGKPQ